MNARQRRQKRRLVDPAVRNLIAACEAAADEMEKTGQSMTVAECRGLATGLRALLAMDRSWPAVVYQSAMEGKK